MSKNARLLKLLRRRWVTPIVALEQVGSFSLAQRISQWRAQGYEFDQREVRTDGGSKVAAYRLAGPR